jgi:hypothetical protein
MLTEPRVLSHLTLTTGHLRASPRAEVGADIIELLRPIVAAGAGEVKGLHIHIEERRDDRVTFTLGWSRDVVAVRCVLAPADSPAAWTHARNLAVAAGQIPTMRARPVPPWLAAIVLPPTGGLPLAQTRMLGDAERCVAWALLEAPPASMGGELFGGVAGSMRTDPATGRRTWEYSCKRCGLVFSQDAAGTGSQALLDHVSACQIRRPRAT